MQVYIANCWKKGPWEILGGESMEATLEESDFLNKEERLIIAEFLKSRNFPPSFLSFFVSV